jgi:type IV secretory pathway TraG/TraD family ATPase VirD4
VLTGAAVALSAVVAWGMWRIWRSANNSNANHSHYQRPGLARRNEVVADAGPKRLVASSQQLRPAITKPRLVDLGHRIGRSRGVEVWSSVEDSTVLLGPPRAGKGLHLVIPWILDHQGPVITTSTRPDNIAVTLQSRKEHGPVAVFDPEGLAPGVPSATKWSPVRGCERMGTAIARAAGLVSESARGTENDAFWRNRARDTVRCLLHAAALAGRPTADLYRWSLSPHLAVEALGILRASSAKLPAESLDSVITGDTKIRDGTWSVIQNTFACLADPTVLEAVSPEPGRSFDPTSFLREGGAVYLLGTASSHSTTATLVGSFIEDVIATARRLAAASPNSRLDPPLALVLDEAANYPLDSLPALMSEGGGTGICTVAVLQSLAQARHHWKADQAQAIWDAATVKVILGGQSDARDLTNLSKLLGEVEVKESSESTRGGEKSTTTSVRHRPILSVDDLRKIPFGAGVLMLRSASPIFVDFQRWDERPDAEDLRTAKVEIEETIRAGFEGKEARLRPDNSSAHEMLRREVPAGTGAATSSADADARPDGQPAAAVHPLPRPAPSGARGLDALVGDSGETQ